MEQIRFFRVGDYYRVLILGYSFKDHKIVTITKGQFKDFLIKHPSRITKTYTEG